MYSQLVRVDKTTVLVCACCARMGVVSACFYECDNARRTLALLSLDKPPMLPGRRELSRLLALIAGDVMILSL